MGSSRQRQQAPHGRCWEEPADPTLAALASTLAQQLAALPRHGVTMDNVRMLLAGAMPATLVAAFLQLDSRNGAQRANDVFALLRRAPPSDALSHLCTAETYAVILTMTAGSARGVAVAHELLSEMRQRGIPRNEAIYTTIMSLCVRAERLQDALAAFDALMEERIEPSLTTLHTLMDAYGQLRQWSNALVVLDAIASKGAAMVWTYNMAIIACGRGACAAEAVTVLDRMLCAGLLPCLTTYTALMSLFCRAGELGPACRVFEAMKAARVTPNTITYSSLINGCDKANSLDAARFYFDEMLANGCLPSVVTYNTLLRACSRSSAWQYALQLWHSMRDAGIKPDIVSVRAWLAVMHAAGCWPAILIVFLERLPRAVTKDPILQSKTCEALWSCGSEATRACAVTLPGAQVAMSCVNHSVSSDHAGGLSVTSTWGVSAAQPGTAAAALHNWLLSLLQTYSWPAHSHAVNTALAMAAPSGPPVPPPTPPPPPQGMAPPRIASPGRGARGGAAGGSADALTSALRLSEEMPGLDPHSHGSRHPPDRGGWGGGGPGARRGGGGEANWGGGPPGFGSYGRGGFASNPSNGPHRWLSGAASHDNTLHPSALDDLPGSEPSNHLHGRPSPPPPAPPWQRDARGGSARTQAPTGGAVHAARLLCLRIDVSHQSALAPAIFEAVATAVAELRAPLSLSESAGAITVSAPLDQLGVWLSGSHTAGLAGQGLPQPLEQLRAQPAVLQALQLWMEQAEQLRQHLAAEASMYPRTAAARLPLLCAALAVCEGSTGAAGLDAAQACRMQQVLAVLLSEPGSGVSAASHEDALSELTRATSPAPDSLPDLAALVRLHKQFLGSGGARPEGAPSGQTTGTDSIVALGLDSSATTSTRVGLASSGDAAGHSPAASRSQEVTGSGTGSSGSGSANAFLGSASLHALRARSRTWDLQPVAEYGESWHAAFGAPGLVSTSVESVPVEEGGTAEGLEVHASASGSGAGSDSTSAQRSAAMQLSSSSGSGLGLGDASAAALFQVNEALGRLGGGGGGGFGGHHGGGGSGLDGAKGKGGPGASLDSSMWSTEHMDVRLQSTSLYAMSDPSNRSSVLRTDGGSGSGAGRRLAGSDGSDAATSLTAGIWGVNLTPEPAPPAAPGRISKSDSVVAFPSVVADALNAQFGTPAAPCAASLANSAAASGTAATCGGGGEGSRRAVPGEAIEALVDMCCAAARGSLGVAPESLEGVAGATTLPIEPPLAPPPRTASPSAWEIYSLYLQLLAAPRVASNAAAFAPFCSALVDWRDRALPILTASAEFATTAPSLLAAACLACGRRALSIAPEWPQVLAGVSGHLLLPPHEDFTAAAAQAATETPLHALCKRVAARLDLPPFEASKYQEALTFGLDGMLRPEKRQTGLASTVTKQELDEVLSKAIFLAKQHPPPPPEDVPPEHGDHPRWHSQPPPPPPPPLQAPGSQHHMAAPVRGPPRRHMSYQGPQFRRQGGPPSMQQQRQQQQPLPGHSRHAGRGRRGPYQ